MDTSNKTILCVGEVLWDVLPDARKPGGAPMNVALHLSRLDHNVIIASRIGTDKNGEELSSFMADQGLDTSNIQVDNVLPTSEVFVRLNKNNNATFEIPEPVAWDHLELTSPLQKAANDAGVIVYGTLGSRNPNARKTMISLLKSKALKLIDVNLRPPYTQKNIVEELLYLADVAKMNEDELHLIASWEGKSANNEPELMEWMVTRYQLRMIVVTLGEKGAILYDKSKEAFHQQNGFQVKVSDTVGAGDAFLAGFISSILNKQDANKSLVFACATGAYVASQTGATPLYDSSDIVKILQQSNPLTESQKLQ